MDSILFKLVINYYYLWNEALFKQNTSWKNDEARTLACLADVI